MVKCTGKRSNRSAIGTRARVPTGDRVRIDEAMSETSYYSQSDLKLHFGLGLTKRVGLVGLRWPTGRIESFSDVEANCLIHIHEEEGVVKTEEFFSAKRRSINSGRKS